MSHDRPLPTVPQVRVELIADRTGEILPEERFLRLRHLTLRNHYPAGPPSRVYRYDVVERGCTDAVAIILEDRGSDRPRVCLRTALRPPLAFRSTYALPIDETPGGSPMLWEVPAGLVEATEQGEAGLRQCAARETQEEVGLDMSPDAFEPLGAPLFLSPGVFGEKVYFFRALVDASSRGEPQADGGAVEEFAEVAFIPVDQAMRAVSAGLIQDIKTEIAIRRLAEIPT